jgi:hypothetical protein
MNHAEQVRLRLRRLAWLLDNSVPLPGLRFRIGIDPLLGLIPGLGDAAGVVLSSYILHQAWRLGVPRSVLLRMWVNVLIEGVFGTIPLIGDVFDAAWKANTRNVALLEAHLAHPRRTVAVSRALLVALIITTLLVVAGVVVLVWLVLRALLQLLVG